MQWLIANSTTGRPLNDRLYISEGEARTDITRLGTTFSTMYRAIPHYTDSRWNLILSEGFRPGDLAGILLPQFSVDVYVPGDAETDNIVVGFHIKGVPEAVFPFKNFCMYSRGVKHVDYGDSDTLPHTSIVYVEFDREQFDIRDFIELIEQICRLSTMKPDDLSVSFPNSNKTFPYTPERIERYFNRRNTDFNRLAQWKANHERTQQLQKELEDEVETGAIGQRLGGGGDSTHHTLRHLKSPFQGVGAKKTKKPGTESEIPDSIKASIRADAQHNRTNHQLPWKDFDTRWAGRLHVSPARISSIRKQIYGSKA